MQESNRDEVVAYLESGSDEAESTDPTFLKLGIPILYSNTGFNKCFAHLYNLMSMTDPDVVFEVGPACVRIQAHRIMLAVNSPVFRSMFFGGMGCADSVRVPDCSALAFTALVQFCYKEHCGDLSIDLALDYLYTAKKYLAPGFENHCVQYLSSNLEVARLFEVLSMADFYVLPTLSAACWKYLETNVEQVLISHLDNLSLDMLLQILRNTKLEIVDTTLFQITVKWIKHECESLKLEPTPPNLRSVGLTALKLIRFPAMTGPELTSIVVPTGIFTDEELSNFFIAAHTPELIKKPKSEYSSIPRRPKPAGKASDFGLSSNKLRSKFIVTLVQLVQEIKPGLTTPFDPQQLATWFSEFGDLKESWLPALEAVFDAIDDLKYEL